MCRFHNAFPRRREKVFEDYIKDMPRSQYGCLPNTKTNDNNCLHRHSQVAFSFPLEASPKQTTVSTSIRSFLTVTQYPISTAKVPMNAAEGVDGPCSAIAVPSDFICPITLELFKTPISTRNGHSFERDALLQWMTTNGGNYTCPLTRMPLLASDLVLNHDLKWKISEWKVKNHLLPAPKRHDHRSTYMARRMEAGALIASTNCSHSSANRKVCVWEPNPFQRLDAILDEYDLFLSHIENSQLDADQ
jgi:U-box domain